MKKLFLGMFVITLHSSLLSMQKLTEFSNIIKPNILEEHIQKENFSGALQTLKTKKFSPDELLCALQQAQIGKKNHVSKSATSYNNLRQLGSLGMFAGVSMFIIDQARQAKNRNYDLIIQAITQRIG